MERPRVAPSTFECGVVEWPQTPAFEAGDVGSNPTAAATPCSQQGHRSASEGLKVLEINAINSSGFHACDMGKFVDAINQLG